MEKEAMNREILEIVEPMFRRELQVTEFDPEAPLVNYGLDSIRSISLVVEMEAAFDIRISDEQAAGMRTLRDVVEQVSQSLSVQVGQGGDDA
ncbi:acyl carrier protein [Streptomyces sp. NPDC056222]|uniref:acyl carrier protein n=1 Tax=Streptomyces sp. NPDC056222 TaxID=3345749 RepID=UPI0035DEC2E1